MAKTASFVFLSLIRVMLDLANYGMLMLGV